MEKRKSLLLTGKMMSVSYLPQDLTSAHNLLDQLLEEVRDEESTLAGGTKLGMGGNALQSLLETKITFGNPANDLVQLTKKLFNDIGIELTPIHEQQMVEQFDFYYMTLSVSLKPGRQTQFRRFECAIDFAPKGKNEPIIQSIFPKSEWKKILNMGVDLNLGLNGNLDWVAGVNPPDIPFLDGLSGNLQAKISTKNQLKALITIPNYSIDIGKTEIVATGEGNSECFWRIEKPDLKKTQTVNLGTVFKVPKGTESIHLSGMALAEPSISWLKSTLKYVFESLSGHSKMLLTEREDERKGKNRLPVGAHEEWSIKLPNQI